MILFSTTSVIMFPIFTDGRLQTASGARTVLSAKTCENHMCVCVCDWIKRHKVNFTATFFVFFFLCYFLSRSQKHMYGLNQDKVWVRTHSAEIRTDTLSASTNKHTNTHTSAFLQTQRNSQLLQKHTHTHTHTHQRLGQCSLSVLPPQMWR